MEALYIKIANYLKFLIAENSKKQTFQLPSETQLQNKFNVSRVTVRQAFDSLKKENLIYAIKGKGYFSRGDILFEENYETKTTIAFIMTTPTNGLHSQIIKGVNDYCNLHNIHLLTYLTYNDAILEQQKIHDAMKMHADGFILLPCDNDTYSNELLKIVNKKPIVLVDRTLHGLNLTTVSSNHTELALNAVKYFHKKGLKDIAYISHQVDLSTSTIEREEGIKKGLLKYMGQLNNNNFVHDSVPEHNLYNFYLQYFLDHKNIQGILATPCNLHLLDALKKMNRKINKDIFLVSIDSIPYANTPSYLPTIIQNGYKIGHTAAEYVYKMIREDLPNKKQTIHIPVKYKNWK